MSKDKISELRSLSVLSKYRGELCGVSIISIVFFHFYRDLLSYAQNNHQTLRLFYRLYGSFVGSIGVDIFLLMSGLGLYYSMKKNSNVLNFYKKRLIRVLLPYLMFAPIITYFLDVYYDHMDIAYYIKDVTTISFWSSGNRLFWYVSFILLLYLVFPVIFKLIDRWGFGGFIGMFLIVISGILFIHHAYPEVYRNVEIAIARTPVFLLGVLWGRYAYEKRSWNVWQILFVVAGLLLRLFWSGVQEYGLAASYPSAKTLVAIFSRYSRVFVQWYAVGVLFLFMMLYGLIASNWKILSRILCWFGSISFELYITHVAIRLLLKRMGYPTYVKFNYFLCVVFSIIISLILQFLTNRIVALINRVPVKRN